MIPKPEITDEQWLSCVGPGWHSIVRPLIERCRKEGISIAQIKEKFGGLRFYVHSAPADFLDAIDAAEALSISTCEECGKPGKRRPGGWIKTLCDEHCGS